MLAIARLGTGGKLALYNNARTTPDVFVTNHSSGRTDIVVDLFDWLTDLPSFTSSPLAPDATVGHYHHGRHLSGHRTGHHP